MSKKTIIGLLIILCLVIYGAIFYKAFIKKEAVIENAEVIQNYTNLNIDNVSQKDSVELFFPKRSPFGEPSRAVSHIANNLKKPKSTNLKNELVKVQSWPKISYFGYVKNNSNENKLIVIKINNKLHKVREQETVENINVKKAYNDSIVLKFNGNIKTFFKLHNF